MNIYGLSTLDYHQKLDCHHCIAIISPLYHRCFQNPRVFSARNEADAISIQKIYKMIEDRPQVSKKPWHFQCFRHFFSIEVLEKPWVVSEFQDIITHLYIYSIQYALNVFRWVSVFWAQAAS